MPDIDERVSALERDVVALQTEVRIQFKEVFTRIKRLEAVLIATSGAHSQTAWARDSGPDVGYK